MPEVTAVPDATTNLGVIEKTFASLAGRLLLDVGCGPGALARALARRGARVTGIDPEPDTVAAARRAAPEARFEVAAAEALPFPDGSFDGAIFLNSLHHVPADSMAAALDEAGRVVGPAGLVVVIEPLAAGSFFAALRAVEDETEVRGRAQEALAEAVQDGRFALVADLTYTRHDAFATLDDFLGRVIAADPARREAVATQRGAIEAAFASASRPEEDGRFVLDQPLRAVTLRTAARAAV